jgi:hypothetical protein
MSQPTLDERVAALEKAVARLSNPLANAPQSATKDWRSTVGMFAGDPIMKEIIEEGQRIRKREK